MMKLKWRVLGVTAQRSSNDYIRLIFRYLDTGYTAHVLTDMILSYKVTDITYKIVHWCSQYFIFISIYLIVTNIAPGTRIGNIYINENQYCNDVS